MKMKLLQPGDLCPCCGRPLKEGLPATTVFYLSCLAEEKRLREAAREGGDTK